MLKKYLRLTIIAVIQSVLPIATIALLIPYLLNQTDNLHQFQAILQQWNLLFLVIHAFFYCFLFFFWPHLTKRLCANRKIRVNGIEYKQALSARWYLLSAFILFELLMLWR